MSYYCVGNVADHADLKTRYQEWIVTQEHLKQRKEFLMKQAEDLKESIDKQAAEFWDYAESVVSTMPRAPKQFSKDWCMHINPETRDIITWQHEGPGVPSFIRDLIKE